MLLCWICLLAIDLSGSEMSKESSGTAHERVFFHVLMMLAACYGAMMLTNWGKMNGEPEVSALSIYKMRV